MSFHLVNYPGDSMHQSPSEYVIPKPEASVRVRLRVKECEFCYNFVEIHQISLKLAPFDSARQAT